MSYFILLVCSPCGGVCVPAPMPVCAEKCNWFFLILGPYGSSHVPLLNRSPALSRISLSFCSKIFFNPVTILFLQIPNTVSTLKIGTKDYKCINSCLSKPLSVLLKYLALCIALNWEVWFCLNFLYILFCFFPHFKCTLYIEESHKYKELHRSQVCGLMNFHEMNLPM